MTKNKVEDLFKTILAACQDVKALDVCALDLAKVGGGYADYIVIASGNSDRQIRAIADRVIEDAYKKCGIHPLGVEGLDQSAWALVDFGDVVCHVFLDEVRGMYHLEDMWPQIKPCKGKDLEGLFTKKKKKAPTRRIAAKAPSKTPVVKLVRSKRK